jgi:hypothetical protein
MDMMDSPLTRNDRRAPSRWELVEHSNCRLIFALVAGLVALLFLMLLQGITPGLEQSFMAGFWRAVVPWLMGCTGVVCLICGAVVAWNLYLLKLSHDHQRAKVGLLTEQQKQTHMTTRLLEQAYKNNDNVKITQGDDQQIKSVEIVRTAVLLEQVRIQEETRVLLQREKEERRQIAGPVSAGAGSRALHGPIAPTPAVRASSEAEEMEAKLAQIPAPSKPGQIQPFAELLDEGVIQAALLVGLIALGYVYREGEWVVRFGSWLDLYSCGVGGVSGSGKTTTVRFLLFQAMLAGARVLMIDPHIHEPEESLAAQFSMFKDIHVQKPCDDDPEKVAKRIRWFMNEYTRRKARGIKTPRIIFVLDEFNEIIALLPTEIKKELAELMLRIAQSGRKFGLFAMVIGQRWSEQDLGGKPYGAAIRTSLAATLAHRFTDESQAQKLAGGKYGAQCLELNQGHYYFRDTHGTMSYTITPDTVSEDGMEIQRLLDALENTVESSVESAENTVKSVVSRTTGPLEIPVTPAPEADSYAENTRIDTLARQVVRLQAQNLNKPEIMKQIWRVNPGGTDAYQQALEEYKQVMAYIAAQFDA